MNEAGAQGRESWSSWVPGENPMSRPPRTLHLHIWTMLRKRHAHRTEFTTHKRLKIPHGGKQPRKLPGRNLTVRSKGSPGNLQPQEGSDMDSETKFTLCEVRNSEAGNFHFWTHFNWSQVCNVLSTRGRNTNPLWRNELEKSKGCVLLWIQVPNKRKISKHMRN